MTILPFLLSILLLLSGGAGFRSAEQPPDPAEAILLCILLIWVLSLTPFFPETPFDNVEFADKWTHFVMYGGTCAVIWWEHLRHSKKASRRPNLRALFVAMLCMVLLGGLMELLQAYATTTRSGEWLDFWADSIGVLLGSGVGALLLFCKRK